MKHEKSDVVIVGAGAAGLIAAIGAASRGARVTVVDTDSDPGGTAQAAGGGTCIAGTPLQRSLGIEDSPELALDDWIAWGGPTVDIPWAKRYLESAVDSIYDPLEKLGVTWASVRAQEGNSVARWHAPLGGGKAVMQALSQEAHRLDIRWRLRTRATQLVADGGSVVGVVVHGPDGDTHLHARSVLLATGGFNNDIELVRRHAVQARHAERILLGGGAGARGDGHRMLAELGAEFVNMDAVWMYPFATPDHLSSDPDRGVAVRGLDGDIWVNRDGVRFHNEHLRGGLSGATALLAQNGATCWSIIDAPIAEQIVVADRSYRDGDEPHRARIRQLLERSPFISQERTVSELAGRIGIDGQQLSETIATHNQARIGGVSHDPEFDRPLHGLTPLTEPPYYAIQLFPLARKNLGGVRTDPLCRVLGSGGRVIEGLFAAGEVAGMAGGHINGGAALEGTMLGPCMFSGRVAGENM